jgi:hypothetical protein
MSGDPACLRAALAREIRKPGALNTRHYPSVGLTLAENPHFALITNCFLPAPNGETDLVASAVHHHGHLLLTTVTTFGPGYEHWRFTTPKVLDQGRELFAMKVIDRLPHKAQHIAFVDADMPHAVVMPKSLTITFALWSSRFPVSWRDHVKRMRIFRGRQQQIAKLATRLGLARALAINPVVYFDYYPVQGGFKGMKERIQFERGPNEDFLCSFFHVLQETNNQSLGRVVDEVRKREKIDNPEALSALLRDLYADRPIKGRLSEGVHHLDHMNFRTGAIERALAALEGQPLHA